MKYYTINEKAAKEAKSLWSFSDYEEESKTREYQSDDYLSFKEEQYIFWLIDRCFINYKISIDIMSFLYYYINIR